MLKLKLQYFDYLMRRASSLEKSMVLGKIEGRRRRGRQRMLVGWCYQLNGHKFEQTPRDNEGQGNLACCSSWGHRESDTTEWLNNNKCIHDFHIHFLKWSRNTDIPVAMNTPNTQVMVSKHHFFLTEAFWRNVWFQVALWNLVPKSKKESCQRSQKPAWRDSPWLTLDFWTLRRTVTIMNGKVFNK